ncbi:acetate--CoA ligase family protein [Thermogemmatispora sp.]|uniref:acetate--CoA ligase family protein n=1 Tax=Thermogemmatispora sp. TaxID=1968838 RepID=UPI002625E7BF|nr:acetate--CoA ligase family protein [Thermogemmatispora sp.]
MPKRSWFSVSILPEGTLPGRSAHDSAEQLWLSCRSILSSGGPQPLSREGEPWLPCHSRETHLVHSAAPAARIEGVLVSPMRSGGLELLVGIVHDSIWGQVLAVGLGGLWVEVLKDTSLRVLPVSREDIRLLLTELQGQALLMGARGTVPADLEQLVEVIYRLCQLAQTLGSQLEALEINPLRVQGGEIEVLDALLSWR